MKMSDASLRRYSPGVHIGNWFEESCLQKEKVRLYCKSREEGELLVEKACKLFLIFHKQVSLDVRQEHIRFGAVVQLMPVDLSLCKSLPINTRPSLSVVINENVVRYSNKMDDKCELTISGTVKPCVRNSFRIVSGDNENRENEILKYGQQFRLQCLETDNDPLLLYTTPKTYNLQTAVQTSFHSKTRGEINLPLGLCYKRNCGLGKDTATAFTNWYCKHVDPRRRFEAHDTPLLSDKPLIITHVATNRNLAAENTVIQTLFGSELLVSVQNYRETRKNIWMISYGHNCE